jgi:hypothetical protein
MSISMIGMDTAQSVFQLHAVDEAGRMVTRRGLQRSELIAFKKMKAMHGVMEAWGAVHRCGLRHGQLARPRQNRNVASAAPCASTCGLSARHFAPTNTAFP